jgi:hypothetical protein
MPEFKERPLRSRPHLLVRGDAEVVRVTKKVTDDRKQESENPGKGDIHPLPVYDDVKKYGPLAEIFERIKQPVIFSRDLLLECMQRLSDAIGDRPGRATLELEETGREAEISVVKIGGLRGGFVKVQGATRRVTVTVEKGPGVEQPVIEVQVGEADECDEEKTQT